MITWELNYKIQPQRGHLRTVKLPIKIQNIIIRNQNIRPFEYAGFVDLQGVSPALQLSAGQGHIVSRVG